MAWEPVEDGTFVQGTYSPTSEGIACRKFGDLTELTTTEYNIDCDNNELTQLMVFVPGDYWLCRHTPAPAVPVEVREAMKELETVTSGFDAGKGAYDIVQQWLATLEAKEE